MDNLVIHHINKSYIECIKIYFTLNHSQQKFFDNQNEFWHDILSALNGIQIVDGYKSSLEVIHAAFCGYYTTFSLTKGQRDYYEAPSYTLLKCLRLDAMSDKAISIWQAYLFVNMPRLFCQLHRSSEYAAVPIFSLKDLDKIHYTLPSLEKIRIGYSYFRKDVFTPQISEVEEDTFDISCYWWSDFKGLFQETITLKSNGLQLSLHKKGERIIIPIRM